MSTLKPPGNRAAAGSSPFARALASTAELEKPSSSHADQMSPDMDLSDFSKALLAQNGGSKDLGTQSPEAQQEAIDAQRKKAERLQLFREINGPDQRAVFQASTEKALRELEATRAQLVQMMAQTPQIRTTRTDLDNAVKGQIVNQGTEGTGFKNLLAHYQHMIFIAQQDIRSTATWQREDARRKAKKRARAGGFEGRSGSVQETRDVWETMREEQAIAIGA